MRGQPFSEDTDSAGLTDMPGKLDMEWEHFKAILQEHVTICSSGERLGVALSAGEKIGGISPVSCLVSAPV